MLLRRTERRSAGSNILVSCLTGCLSSSDLLCRALDCSVDYKLTSLSLTTDRCTAPSPSFRKLIPITTTYNVRDRTLPRGKPSAVCLECAHTLSMEHSFGIPLAPSPPLPRCRSHNDASHTYTLETPVGIETRCLEPATDAHSLRICLNDFSLSRISSRKRSAASRKPPYRPPSSR